jgi:hypothetical protein
MTVMFYDSAEGEQTFTTTNWTQAASKSGNLRTTQNLIWFSAEYTADTSNREVGIRVLIDGNEVSFDYHTCTLANQYRKFCDFGLYASTIGSHTISVEVRALTAGVTVKVRRIRLAVMQE